MGQRGGGLVTVSLGAAAASPYPAV